MNRCIMNPEIHKYKQICGCNWHKLKVFTSPLPITVLIKTTIKVTFYKAMNLYLALPT